MASPLAGKKILVTRSEDQATAFIEKLKEESAIPLVAPLLSFKPRILYENKKIFTKLHDFTWVFFTSANGVKFFFNQLDYWGLSHSVIDKLNTAVVGKKTNDMLREFGFKADFQPENFQGRQMVQEFLQQYSQKERIILFSGNRSNDDIPRELEQNHVFFRKIVIYDTLLNEESRQQLLEYIENDIPDAYTFTSPSTIDAFLELTKVHEERVKSIKMTGLCVCIGTTTENKAIEEGFKHILVPDVFTIEGMTVELTNYFLMKG
ncbi:hypothetical protein GH741_09660 [Aquibacillus halophilus]|uniref:Uroporphyrinogen-III synthase n=1 Tax=Aquibacillus halophilus TaxID=930132 RepID=A0A6A8DCE3_9BACI|nr:uroporphyrinogen-III synthase [Aquibacillus halophilus]MRH42950.1 hypothetical protein [Aquibacillus halophilus]